jgi:3-methyladenine DNA glycosylase/8-oxoguanine DNA glycosylase
MTESEFSRELERALAHLRSQDPMMAEIIDVHGPCHEFRPQFEQDPYDRLIRAIVFQQLSGKAAATIHGRFLAIYGAKVAPEPQLILKTPMAKLRKAGLSKQKASYIKNLAKLSQQGKLPLKREQLRTMADADIIAALTEVKGVGQWTVEMLLIFSLGRLDVLPVDDLGVRQGYSLAARKRKMITPKELMKLKSRWSPYSSVAAWYFWRVADKAKTLKKK